MESKSTVKLNCLSIVNYGLSYCQVNLTVVHLNLENHDFGY